MMNKTPILKAVEIAVIVMAILGVFIMFATTISHNSICLVILEVYGISWAFLVCIYCILLRKETKKKRCLIGAVLSFVLAVFSICVAIGII